MDFFPASAFKASLGAVSHAWLACSLPALLLAASFAPLRASAESRPDGREPRELAEVGAARDFIRFAAVGGPRKVCDRVRSWDPRFVIAPGAGSYPAGGAEVLCPPLEEGHYDATRGPVHIFFLSGDSAASDRGGRDGSQARWLRKALADSPAAWKIVYILHAPYSSAASRARRALRWPLKEWGADAVMSGRDGGYERLRIDGLTFFVNGPDLGRSPAEDARLPGSECVFDEDAGALLVEADGQRIDFRYVTAEGLVVDAHTLRKASPAGAPAAVPAAARR